MKKNSPHSLLCLLAAVLILVGLGYAAAGWLSGTDRSVSETKAEALFTAMGISRVAKDGGPVDARMLDLRGRPVKLSEFRGKIVFLNFWTTWCPSCIAESESLDRLFRRLKKDAFAMAAVSVKEPAETVRRFLKSEHLAFPVFLDPEGNMGRQFSVRSIPVTYILDRRGNVLGTAIGARQWDSPDSIAFFQYLLSLSQP